MVVGCCGFSMFKGKRWTYTTILTAVSFPGFLFTIFMIINIGVASEGSSSGILKQNSLTYYFNYL